MNPAIKSIENKMRQQLKEVVTLTDPVLKAKTSVAIITLILQELRAIVKELGNTDKASFIQIHKTIIPAVYSEYIYNASLYNLLVSKPFGNRQKEYFIRESERIEDWFSDNETFLRYYRSGRSDLDHEYFSATAHDPGNYIDLYSPFIGDSFYSRFSFIAAMGMAYQRLQKDIALLIIQASPSFAIASLHWTPSKTDLTELIYALYAAGAFNKGKATIKEITRFFEESLQIQLGNTSVTFQEILRRKDSTAFLARLNDSFDRYIDQVEQKNIR